MLKEKLGRLYDSVMVATLRARLAWGEVKEGEDAMEVIQVVMLIAVGVIAIAAVWAGVNGLLKDWWEAITEGAKVQNTTLK